MGKKNKRKGGGLGVLLAKAFLSTAAEFHGIKKPRKQAEQLDLLSQSPKAPPKSSRHRCHAEGCSKAVAPRFLMCRPHWTEQPPWAQRLIWTYYREGQEGDKRPSPHYVMAQRMVVLSDGVRRGQLTPSEAAQSLEATAHAVGLDVFEEVKSSIKGME